MSRRVFVVCVALVFLLLGCERRFVRDAGPNHELDSGPRPDAGPLPLNSEPSIPATVARDGSGGFLLRGVVLAPGGAIDGEVLVVGNVITCVAADCSAEAMAGTVTVIETNGVISPGLIDAHNHLTYDFLPEWVSGSLYGNRYEWSDVTAYEDHIAPFADGRNDNDRVCPGAKWGELRSIIHGTSTVMGQSFNRSCLNRLARNADHHHGLGYDHLRTTITSVRDINDTTAAGLIASFTDPTEPVTRYAVHMQEGVSGSNVTEEFESFAGRDTRANRHMGTSLLEASDGSFRGTGLLIHSMQLTEVQLMEALDTGAHVVWSPSSNLILYGETAPIADILRLGVPVGLGPDWTVSGEDDMLSEMRFAHAFGTAEGIAALTPERIWRMATEGSAEAVGLAASIGQLVVGAVADITVFGRRGMDPYSAVLDSRAPDVRLVLIDGAGYYGDLNLEMATSVNGECEMIDACSSPKFLCVANTPGSTSASARADETYENIRAQLIALLTTYGRQDELAELVACP